MNRKPAGILLVAEETPGGYRLPREARDDHAAHHDRAFNLSQPAQLSTFRLADEHTGEES
jgi:hypothetical protein